MKVYISKIEKNTLNIYQKKKKKKRVKRLINYKFFNYGHLSPKTKSPKRILSKFK